MKPLGPEREHYWLAIEMSQRVGLDLAAEMKAGRLDPSAWADMVAACRGCPWAEHCPAWLAAHHAVGEAPRQCVNRDAFAMLGDVSGEQ